MHTEAIKKEYSFSISKSQKQKCKAFLQFALLSLCFCFAFNPQVWKKKMCWAFPGITSVFHNAATKRCINCSPKQQKNITWVPKRPARGRSAWELFWQLLYTCSLKLLSEWPLEKKKWQKCRHWAWGVNVSSCLCCVMHPKHVPQGVCEETRYFQLQSFLVFYSFRGLSSAACKDEEANLCTASSKEGSGRDVMIQQNKWETHADCTLALWFGAGGAEGVITREIMTL